MTQVRKAVIAAAGYGTRFLPQTKAMPKEMLPLVDKPIIQYVVEDLVQAGIKDIIIVGAYSKRSIEDHFDSPNGDLIANLRLGGPKKQHFIDEIEAIANLANFVFVRQRRMYGNGVPLLDVEHLIGDEPFIYAFADELIPAKPNVFEQSIAAYERFGSTIFPCIKVTQDADYDNFGIVAGEQIEAGVLKMSRIDEKPGKENAASDMGSHGGYVITPDFFPYLHRECKRLGEGQELYMQPAFQAMIDDGKPIYACAVVGGKFCDTGSKLDYLKTVVDFALKREDIGRPFRDYLQERLRTEDVR
jgi:UTP--glucose-1-phosphate uridylyltransferase